MALNLLDLLTGTQKGFFTTIHVPNEVKQYYLKFSYILYFIYK
jgi:hypothetical protein